MPLARSDERHDPHTEANASYDERRSRHVAQRLRGLQPCRGWADSVSALRLDLARAHEREDAGDRSHEHTGGTNAESNVGRGVGRGPRNGIRCVGRTCGGRVGRERDDGVGGDERYGLEVQCDVALLALTDPKVLRDAWRSPSVASMWCFPGSTKRAVASASSGTGSLSIET